MKKITTIYLGVNGVVIVPIGQSMISDSGFDSWGTINIDNWKLHFSPDVIQFINALSIRDDTDIRWFTRWNEEAATQLSPLLELEGRDWPVVAEVQNTGGSRKLSKSNSDRWGKMPSFKADIFAHPIKRLIWIDCEIDSHTNEIDNWLDPSGVLEDDRMYIAPNPLVGLTKNNLSEIIEFLNT